MDSIKTTNNFVFQTYQRHPKTFVKGKGVFLFDENNNKYIDFLSGISVCNLGHCNSQITKAIVKQSKKLVHVSNLFYTKPQAKLAKILCKKSFADKVFFANSGAEANEAAIKLARRYFQKKNEERFKIISMKQSFHGRTMASLSATGQDKIKNGFSPLLKGFAYAPFNDFNALKKQIDKTVCAIMLEPIQGEGGVIPATRKYLKKIRALCDKKGILLIFDEVQCGMGRCGSLFAHQMYGVTPDIMTIAKALGNGLPIGAMLATNEASSGFDFGSHATTFGGTPLVAAAALEVIKIISKESFLHQVYTKGLYFKEKLSNLKEKHPQILALRGKGLLLGLELQSDASFFVNELMKKGFITNAIQDNVLRLSPPLIISKAHINKFISALDRILRNQNGVK